MNWSRRLTLAVGLLLAVATLLVLTVPAVGNAVPLASIVEQLGGDFVFVALFGLLAVVLLVIALAWRGVNGLNQTTPPTPEEVQSVPRFGGDFDDEVDERAGIRDRFFSDRPAALRERVREAAVTAEMRASGCSRTEAVSRVDAGTWTSDREAAAFLSGADGPSPPVRARVRAALGGRAWYQRGARRAADAAVRRSQGAGKR